MSVERIYRCDKCGCAYSNPEQLFTPSGSTDKFTLWKSTESSIGEDYVLCAYCVSNIIQDWLGLGVEKIAEQQQ